MGPWREIADRVHVRRYRFYDQSIGAIVGRSGVAIVDTRSIPSQAEELRSNLRELTAMPVTVVNTHHHYDHTFGNSNFRPCPIWGHVRCAERMRSVGELERASIANSVPELAEELAAVVIDPPDRTFDTTASVDLGDRQIELRYLGRGHTDDDIVVVVPDAGVLFAGDLLENGATPFFGDGYPLDWPATARAVRDLVSGLVVPGHGEPDGMAFVDRQVAEFESNAALARRVHAAEIPMDDAIESSPYPSAAAREPLERALAQLRGELD